MLKKSITYTDYNDNEVTENFYFNFTKLELIEKDLEFGGLEDNIQRLTETQDAKEAYGLFKKLILAAYGEKSEDGKRFIKEDADGRPLSKKFEESPACSELIMEFLQNSEVGAQFIEATLPAKLVAEVKAAQANTPPPTETVELPTSPPLRDRIQPKEPEPSDEELLQMKPQDMTHDQLQRAFALKNKQ